MLYPRLKILVETDPDAVLLQVKRRQEYVRYTRRDVFDRARATASHLASIGVSPGDRVALFAENGPEWVIAYLSIHFAGATAVPLDAQYSELELATLIPFAEAGVLLTTATLRAVADWSKIGVEHVLSIDRDAPDGIFELPDAPDDFEPPVMGPEDLMSLIFTSGTTGDPKCAMLTCNNFLSNADAVLEVVRFTTEDNMLSILPLHHCYAFTATVLTPMVIGAKTTFETTLKGPNIVAAMQETGVTIMTGVPKLFALFERRIFSVAESKPWPTRFAFRGLLGLSRLLRRRLGLPAGRILFPSVRKRFGAKFRFFVSGGAKLDREVSENLLDVGIWVLEGYGLTESAPILTMMPPGTPRPGKIGPPIPGVELRINDPDADGVGEIIARGPNVMKGYYKRPDATAEMIRDGWLHTGDLGFVDKDGWVTITGRAKEVIVLATGKNVYPEDVERAYESSG